MLLNKIKFSILVVFMLTGMVFSGEKYSIDQSHTSVSFVVKHMVLAKVRGNFHEFTGTIIFDEADVTRSSVQGTVKVASIDTDNDKRDDHLRGADFFDVEKYPEITFSSTRIEKRGDNYVCSGNLTMRGVTKEVEIPFTITGKITDPWGNTRIGIEAGFTINRQDFGITWSKIMDNGGLVVSNDVKIELVAELIKS